jgi:N-glycosylase/DNA lyase
VLRLSFPEPYDLGHTFDCGQIFRFETFDNGKSYLGPLKDRIVKIESIDSHTLEITSNKTTGLEALIRSFLRVGDDYLAMQKAISRNTLMKKIVQTTSGLHLLNQDTLECCVSFILSQCSNIPRIKQNLQTLCSLYGEKVEFEGKTFTLFPEREKLCELNSLTYRDMGFGYRAEYLANFICNYPEFLNVQKFETNEFNAQLMELKGIGQKVADCIQLFGYGDLGVFPVDTWMEKFMIKYFNGGQKAPLRKLRQMGQNLFGKWAGYAQQLIFHYARCFDPLLS